MSDRPDLDRLWDDVPVGRPDLDAALRGGTRIRRRRQTVGAVVTAAVLVLGIGTGTALWPRPDEVPSPAPAVPSPPSADGATLYYLLDEPVPEDPSFEPATLLTSREVVVEDTGRPGYDALHALLTLEPPVAGLTEGLNVLDQPGEEPTIDVRSVTHDDGVVRVELTGTPWDPYPSVDFCCPPNGEVVTQQLVHTVQAALGTTDPVEFDSRGIWFDRLDGPVEADPDLVVPPTGASAVEEVPLPTGPTGPGEEELVGTLGLDADGCVVVERGSLPAPLLLPIGWTAWLVSGELVLLDDRGALAARGGQSVRIAYAYGKVDRGPCGGPDQVRVDLLSIR